MSISQMINTDISLKQPQRESNLNSFKTDDIYAFNLIQSLIVGYPFLPFSGASLRPFCMAHIINDIVVNNRCRIIEFGAGISTILIGRLIKRNNLNATLLSIEHDKNWVNALSNILKTEQIDDVVSVQYVPLKTCKLGLDDNKWYSLSILKELTKKNKFDMVLIDGPPAWEAEKMRARYPAVPFISSKLNKNFSIYLDDAIRAGEQSIIKIWEMEYGIQFKISGKTLAYYYGGNSFYTEPFCYY